MVLLAWVLVVWMVMRELCVSSIGRDDGLCLLLVDLVGHWGIDGVASVVGAG